ncbi:MAG: aldehyde oxidase, partial [Rhodospirillales bacterium]|nr:aldehyde oxidase [Rhodospirillales bacterium]
LGAGFLTGGIDARTAIGSTDFRASSPRFTNEAREANQGIVDLLRRIGAAKVMLSAPDLGEIETAIALIEVQGARLPEAILQLSYR